MAILLSALALVGLTSQASPAPERRINLAIHAQTSAAVTADVRNLDPDQIDEDLDLSRDFYPWRDISLSGGHAFDLQVYPLGDQKLIGPATSVVGRLGLHF